MNKIESKLHVPSGVKQDVVKFASPSEADAILMAKLFSYSSEGSWVRLADFPASDAIKRTIRNWIKKGWVYYVQDQISSQWLLVLEDKCVQRCWEVLAAAEVRAERSMLDQKPKPRKKTSPWVAAAAVVLTAVILGILVASVLS